MGLDRAIHFAKERTPAWPSLVERLAARGLVVQLRMIDGQLCLPDEMPEGAWQELRLSTPRGMMTLRREPKGIRLVIWGNADAGLLKDRDDLAAALIELTQGSLQE
jgi:hypothetical protein